MSLFHKDLPERDVADMTDAEIIALNHKIAVDGGSWALLHESLSRILEKLVKQEGRR